MSDVDQIQVLMEVVNQGVYHVIVFSFRCLSLFFIFHQFLACRLTSRIQGLLYDVNDGPGTIFALRIGLDVIDVSI